MLSRVSNMESNNKIDLQSYFIPLKIKFSPVLSIYHTLFLRLLDSEGVFFSLKEGTEKVVEGRKVFCETNPMVFWFLQVTSTVRNGSRLESREETQ